VLSVIFMLMWQCNSLYIDCGLHFFLFCFFFICCTYCALSLEFMKLLMNFHLAIIEYLYRGRRAVSLQMFTTWHSNRKLPIVTALSTIFTQFGPETIEFGKIAQHKGHFAIQGHSRSPIFVPIESSCTTSYQDDS